MDSSAQEEIVNCIHTHAEASEKKMPKTLTIISVWLIKHTKLTIKVRLMQNLCPKNLNIFQNQNQHSAVRQSGCYKHRSVNVHLDIKKAPNESQIPSLHPHNFQVGFLCVRARAPFFSAENVTPLNFHKTNQIEFFQKLQLNVREN